MNRHIKCSACNDTGMTIGSQFLDCAACEAAVERAAIDDFGRELNGWPISDMCWAMYQLGKRAGAAEAVPEKSEAQQRAKLDDWIADTDTNLRTLKQRVDIFAAATKVTK